MSRSARGSQQCMCLQRAVRSATDCSKCCDNGSRACRINELLAPHEEQLPREAQEQSGEKPCGVQHEAKGTGLPPRVAPHFHTSLAPCPAPANLPVGSSSCRDHACVTKRIQV